ncbi:MAG: YdcH family protein [Hyphomonas sp.]|nr:YdcH family protein [Hyphomonas sp.]
MSLKGRINELANKHRKLDEIIHEEQKRPSADALRLKRLKREKLQIKEQLHMLETG